MSHLSTMKTSSVKSAHISALQLSKITKIEFTSSLTCVKSRERRRTTNLSCLSNFLFSLKMLKRMIREECTYLKLPMTRASFLLAETSQLTSELMIEPYLDFMQSLNTKAMGSTLQIATPTSALLSSSKTRRPTSTPTKHTHSKSKPEEPS